MRIERASRIVWTEANEVLANHEHYDCDGYEDEDDNDGDCDWSRELAEALAIIRDLIPFHWSD